MRERFSRLIPIHFQCGEKTNFYVRGCKNCSKSFQLVCQKCRRHGHNAENCPDNWRAYHNTVSILKQTLWFELPEFSLFRWRHTKRKSSQKNVAGRTYVLSFIYSFAHTSNFDSSLTVQHCSIIFRLTLSQCLDVCHHQINYQKDIVQCVLAVVTGPITASITTSSFKNIRQYPKYTNTKECTRQINHPSITASCQHHMQCLRNREKTSNSSGT